MSATPIRLGSANFYQRSNNNAARNALFDFAPMCDIFGPLEFGGPERRRMLEDLTATGYFDFYKPVRPGSAPALVWDTQRLEPLDLKTIKVADGRKVLSLPGRRAELADLYATWGLFRDLSDRGRSYWIASWHSPAHVEFWLNTGRRDMYREALSRLLAERRKDWRWAILGDWNVEISKPKPTTWKWPAGAIERRGGEFMWKRHPARKGTHGKRRVIDGAASNMRCLKTRVVDSGVGDHDFALGLFDPGHTVGGR